MAPPSVTPWHALHYVTQLRLWKNGDPRVPEGWLPPRVAARLKGNRPATIIVTLTPFLLSLSEEDLWSFLKDSWEKAELTPQTVTFRTPAGVDVIKLPVPGNDIYEPEPDALEPDEA